MIDIQLKKRGVYLGKTGEKGRYRVWMDVSEWVEEYEGGTGLMLYTGPKGNTAPMRTVTEFDGEKTRLYGYVTAEETREAGTGVIEARWESAGVVAKSDHFNTVVMESSYTGKDVGNNTPDWVSELMTELNAAGVFLDEAAHLSEDVAEIRETIEGAETVAKAAAVDSEAWAVGKREGQDVEEGDPTYCNHAKYYAQQSGGSATAAVICKEDAEAWAVGQRGGLDVGSADPAYQNNAKYWSDHAFSGTPEGYEALAGNVAAIKQVDIGRQLSLYNAYNAALFGEFTDGTNNGVSFAWNADHTVCTLNSSVGRSEEARNRFMYSETGLPGMKPGDTLLFKVSRSKTNIGVSLYWYINGSLGSQTRITSPTNITVPADATGILCRLYVLPEAGTLTNDTIGIEILSGLSNKELAERVASKQAAPAAAGSAGQVLGLGQTLAPEWVSQPDPTEVIDDTAGNGDTDKTWSADRLSQTENDIENLIENNSFNFLQKYGTFVSETNRGVSFQWDNSHTVCVLNCSSSPSQEARNRYLYSETGLCGMQPGKTYLFDVHRSRQNTGVDLYWYLNGSLGTQERITEPTYITVPSNATGVLSRVYVLAGAGTLTNATVSVKIVEAHSNAYLEARLEERTPMADTWVTPTGDETDRTAEIEDVLSANGICNLAPGDYYVTNIEMPDESVLKGSGIGKTTIYMITGETGCCVKLGSKCSVSDLSLDGQEAESYRTFGDRYGVGWVGTYESESTPGTYPLHSQVSGLYIEGFTGGGIYCTNTSMRLISGLQASDVMILSCWAGVYIKKYSEFSQFTNIKANGCYYGCVNNGGNNMFTNCNFSGNAMGLLMDDTEDQSPNNSHGSYVGCVFDHSGGNEGYAMTLIGLDSGEMFVGCQIFYGKTSITGCTGIRFVGCNYGRKTGLTVKNSNAVCWDSCQFREATDTPLTKSGNTGLKFNNCMLYAGTAFDPAS